ncbi:unnamed protein product [Bemisia tabaci]|uniref:Uncharacterized protein n=1 Tax=Bemisia tabaci TaxID=7038 RepID=A0A9P0F410_BEMTA|nr:unnamed protein product [Bemisia tabaci]
MVHLPQIRKDHVKYISELAFYSNEVNTTFKEMRTDKENKETADLALRGLQLPLEWSSVVTELYSWKLFHPTDHHQNKECPQEAEEYERVSIMLQLHGRVKICADQGYCNDQRPASLNVSYGNLFYRSHQTQYSCRTPGLCASPSSTQLYMVRTMLESLIADKSGGKRTLRKDIDGQYHMRIDHFHKTSYNWNYLLGFSESLQQCCDLSQRWYREFYLEMTMGRRIQVNIGNIHHHLKELFGEGLNWAGCTMIVLLGQQRRFKALDFCYRILRVQRVDGKDENVKGINLKRMVDQIRRFRVLNIFATLNKYLKSSEHDSASVEHVRCFPPPIHLSLAAHAHYYRPENLQSQTVHNL